MKKQAEVRKISPVSNINNMHVAVSDSQPLTSDAKT